MCQPEDAECAEGKRNRRDVAGGRMKTQVCGERKRKEAHQDQGQQRSQV